MKKARSIIRTLLLVTLLVVVSVLAGAWIQRARRNPETERLKAELAEARGLVRDWAGLARYREADARIGPPLPDERRVVFMGDSITDYWSREESGGFFPGKPYINRGITGQTTAQMLLRFRQDVIELSPRAVVILGGINDFQESDIETALRNLSSMAELADAHHVRVVLASVLPVNDYGKMADGTPALRTRTRPLAQILELNKRIKEYAEAHHFTYLDYATAMRDERGMLRADFSDDGLHPNARGYAVMTPLAEEAITNALK